MDHNFSFEAIIEIADTTYASSAKCEVLQQWMLELYKMGQTSSTSAA